MNRIILSLLVLAFASGSLMADEPAYRITSADFEVALRPEPDSFRVVTRIPQASKVKILKKIQLDQGMAKINWYEVEYEGKNGWLSGSSFEDDRSELTYSIKYISPDEGGTRSSIAGTAF